MKCSIAASLIKPLIPGVGSINLECNKGEDITVQSPIWVQWDSIAHWCQNEQNNNFQWVWQIHLGMFHCSSSHFTRISQWSHVADHLICVLWSRALGGDYSCRNNGNDTWNVAFSTIFTCQVQNANFHGFHTASVGASICSTMFRHPAHKSMDNYANSNIHWWVHFSTYSLWFYVRYLFLH